MVISEQLKYPSHDIMHFTLGLLKIYLNFLRNKFRLLNKPDFASEIFSWERHYYYEMKSNKELFQRSEETKESILKVISKFDNNIVIIKCLEVGCGPTSQFFTSFFQKNSKFKVISVDPLANFYNALHIKYNSDYDIKCIPGFGETLNKIFPKNKFQIVYSQNAIDHSQSPVKFIRNMYDVLEPGGFLILYGILNEGSNQNWLGLHKWDIVFENRKLLLSNKKKTFNKYNLTRNLQLNLIYEKLGKLCLKNENYETYTIIYQKLS